jgi:hypothetical protein
MRWLFTFVAFSGDNRIGNNGRAVAENPAPVA